MVRMACPKMEGCSLFPVFSSEAFLKVWQISYCEGEFGRCIRYQQAMCGQRVAPTLLPNGKHLPILTNPSEDR